MSIDGGGKYLVPNGELIYPKKVRKLLLSEPAHITGNSATAQVCFLNVTFFFSFRNYQI